MRNSKGLTVVLVCVFTISFYSARAGKHKPNAADLVRAVRESEMWMYNFESLYFRAKGKWTTTPKEIAKMRIEIKERFDLDDPNEKQFPGLRKTSEDILEYAVDSKRVRYLTDDPGYWRQLKIWDGNELRIHEKYYNHPQNCYILYNTIPDRMFHELFACYYGWPRSQAHSFWWYPRDVTRSVDLYGQPVDFTLVGKQVYQEIPCYVLNHDYIPKDESTKTVYRWFVGQDKPLLYGVQRLYHNQVIQEHWTLDYREVMPGGWFPMKTGWSLYDTDEAGRWYLQATKNYKVVDFQVNKSLHEELFQLNIEPGVEIQDHRSGELRRYKKWPSLLGKALPSLKKFDLRESLPPIGIPILLCFVDFEQRPSRNCITQLAKQAKQLKNKNVAVVVIHAPNVDENALDEWVGKNNIPFQVGLIRSDEKKTRFEWGVKSLPWLILTDGEHVVTAEGFGLDELDSRMDEIIQQKSSVRKISGLVSGITGNPQKDVEIKIVPSQSGLSISNSEGRFNLEYEPKIDDWPETDYYLSARHEALNLAAFQLIDENTESVELRLEPAVTLTGTAVDAEGRYVAGAEVRVLMRGANWKGSITNAITHTNANGFFRFKAISTELPISNIIVTAKGYCQHFINRVDIKYAKNDIKLKTITLHEADLSVSGVVVDVNDQPVSGAFVKVLGGGEPRTDTTTDSDGRFKVEKLGRGGIRIIANRNGDTALEGFVDSRAGATDVKVQVTEVYKSPRLPGSKVGKSLSDINNPDIGFNTRTLEGSAILLCFFNFEQRPSRNCIIQLARQEKQLKGKGVTVIAIHTSKVEEKTFHEWVKDNNIPFPVRIIQNDDEKTRFSWGVKSLPWLILTDREHVVITEGFGFDEMDNMIEEMNNVAQ